MRRAYYFLAPAVLGPLVLSSCNSQPDSLSPSSPSFTISCVVSLTRARPNPLTAAPNSTNNSNASWVIKNNGSGAITLTGETFLKKGAVIAVRSSHWASFPFTLAGGAQIDADLIYDVGASGTGTVGMTVLSNCSSPLSLPSYSVNVGSPPVQTGIPYGLWGIKPDTLINGTIWTGSSLSDKDPARIVGYLTAAQHKNPKIGMWMRMTGGELVFKDSTTGRFLLDAWKDTLDARADTLPSGISAWHDDFLPYINNGTFQGIILLDDLAGFTPPVSYADVEAMAAHSKRRYPALPTAVRDRATELQKRAPVCTSCPGGHRPHRVLDAAWAQFRTGLGTAASFRDLNITAAKQESLGVVLGINITQGINMQDTVPVATILQWGNELLKPGVNFSDYACGFFLWNNAYGNLTHPNFTTLANLAKSHVKAPCKRRP